MFQILTTSERDTLLKWNYAVTDKSITTQYLKPFWDWGVKLVHHSVAPNILSLGGLLCIISAFQLSMDHFDDSPRLIAVIASTLLFMYMTLDAMMVNMLG